VKCKNAICGRDMEGVAHKRFRELRERDEKEGIFVNSYGTDHVTLSVESDELLTYDACEHCGICQVIDKKDFTFSTGPVEE
jgi:hypothetical protein